MEHTEIDPRNANERYEHARMLPDGTFLASFIFFEEQKGDKKAGWIVTVVHRYEKYSKERDPNVYLSSARMKTLGPFKKESEAKKTAVSAVNEFDLSRLASNYYYTAMEIEEEVRSWK